MIHVDMKSLNLSNEDANNRAVWKRAIKLKKLIQDVGILPASYLLSYLGIFSCNRQNLESVMKVGPLDKKRLSF